MIFTFGKSIFKHCIIGQLEGFSQKLFVNEPTLKHVTKHRQKSSNATEAGGQLFGTINDDKVCVVKATGPYSGDQRARHSYRSNPIAAQHAIDKLSQRGLLYLGEWHTHAEDQPSASSFDDNTMHRIIENSRLNSNSLLMLIVGRSSNIDGLAIWNISKTSVYQWQLEILKK